ATASLRISRASSGTVLPCDAARSWSASWSFSSAGIVRFTVVPIEISLLQGPDSPADARGLPGRRDQAPGHLRAGDDTRGSRTLTAGLQDLASPVLYIPGLMPRAASSLFG